MGQHLNMNMVVMKTPMQVRQRGVVLLIALIALVAMTLAGIALMRSVDTANVIAGNFAFKESTVHASDRGIELAVVTLPATVAPGNGTTPVVAKYYPVRQPTDAQGLPTTVDWTAVPKVTIPTTGNDVQYVIERMCEQFVNNASNLPVASANGPDQANRADVTDYCVTATRCTSSPSINTAPICQSGDIFYRVTTRVQGPRGTVSVVQSMVSM